MLLTPIWKDTSRQAWSPWRELRAMQRDLDRIFESAPTGENASLQAQLPTYDVEESENAFFVTVELPGVKPEEVQVSVKDGRLDVSAESKGSTRERKYRVAFTLPTDIAEDKLEASLDHGVLTLALPKAAKPEARQIPVKTGKVLGETKTPEKAPHVA